MLYSLARNFIPCIVLVQPRKTGHFSELSTGCKAYTNNNQMNT